MSIGQILLEVLAQLFALCGAWAWPVVVLLVLVVFRKQIPGILGRVRELAFPGLRIAFGYGEASVDPVAELEAHVVGVPVAAEEVSALAHGPDAAPEESLKPGIRWENSGNLFWLGRDLMWTMDMLLRGAPAEQIRFGLGQSLHPFGSWAFRQRHLRPRSRRDWRP